MNWYDYWNYDEDVEDDNPYADCFKHEKEKEIYMNGDDDDEWDNCAPGFLGDRYNKPKPFNWED